jgi:hypothetical protein
MNSKTLLSALLISLTSINGLHGAGAASKAPPAIQVYAGPSDNAYRSNRYAVEIQLGANWSFSYVYSYGRQSYSMWHQGTIPTASFTTFGTSGAATVRVSIIGGFVNTADVSPKSKLIPVQLANGVAILTVSSGDKLWITLNGDDANPLFIFADGLKPAVPAGATYFGAGVRDIAPANGNHYIASNNETIYLDAGAWVRGNIDLRGKTGIRIMGPGVLSGDLWTAEAVQSLSTFEQMMEYTMLLGDWGKTNGNVSDLIIVDSPAYNFFGGLHEAVNVKLLSPWYYQTGGFTGVNKVDRSFAFVGDNVFFTLFAGLANDNVTITNSFAAATTNAIFCGGYWGNPPSGYSASVQNVDVRTYNSPAWVPFGSPLTPALFQIWTDSTNPTFGYSNQTYQDIRVEGDLYTPLAMLKNMVYPWGGADSPPQPLGNSSNLVFKNVTVAGTQNMISEIKGLDAANGFHNVSFENLKINGALVTQSNWSNYFDVNSYVSNLSFTATCKGSQGGCSH